MSSRGTRAGRIIGDLLRPATRGDALHRVRRRAVSGLLRLTGREDSSAQRPDAWYVGEWKRLASAVLGPDAGSPALDAAAAPRAVRRATRARAEAELAAAIARGDDLEQATCRTVTALAAADEWATAWATAEGVARLADGATASALGHGVLLHRRRQPARAWTRMAPIPDAVLARYLPVEAVDAALATGSEDARRRAVAIAAPSETAEAPVIVDLAGRLLAFGERDAAAALLGELRRRPSVDLDARRRHARRLMEGWLDPPAVQVPAGAVPVGVIGYRTPDHVLTSGNLGDHIQTLAMLGNLARLSDVELSGEEGLGALATELQSRVRADLRLPGVRGAVHLLPVDRDFSSASDVPAGTWMVAFGWHMHSLFELRTDFPYHPSVRPLFVSFHVSRLEMLTEEGLAYLRRNGPVGCRDWTTVYLLLGAGVDAFFSGCLTTTIDTVFPARSDVYGGGGAIGVIDLPERVAGRDAQHVRSYSHQSDAYRSASAVDGIRAADAALAGYQRDLERAVTKRLHAYLPLTSLGVPVEFAPRHAGDVRFAGLTGLLPGEPRLDEMRSGIRDLLAAVFERIVGGASEDEVRALWRERTAGRVAEARERFAAPPADPPTTIDVEAAVAASRAAGRRFGPHESVDATTITDVVLAYDQNLELPAAVLVESMLANASGPLRLWVLSRGLTTAYQEWLAAAFPALPITFLPCDGISYAPGPTGRPRRLTARITISTMDRLLLPTMLPHVDRAVYLDVDTLMLDDVCRLARTDLDGHPIGARDSSVSEASEWRRAGTRLPGDKATELRRRMSLRHGYGHAALNAGVLVLDLARMRRDDFTTTTLGLVEEYGFHDQDAMLAYVGPQRKVLEPRWNALPALEDVADPGIVHWASLGKPWDPQLTHEQVRWQAYAARLRERAGVPPAPGAVLGEVSATEPEGSLRNPLAIGPASGPLSAGIERVIERVRAEHLSYLDATSLRTLATSLLEVEAAGIEGFVVEAGTARGGSAIVLAAAKAPTRRMRAYDVFGMIPPPGDRDGEDVHRRYATIASGASKGIDGEVYYGYRSDLLGEVTESFARHGLPLGRAGVELVQGRFEDTLELDEPVAFAHLDGDWYASTMTCLVRIAPRLAVGGRIVIDDYDTWSGCRAAVDEYFTGRPGFRFERRGRLHIVRV